MSFYGLSMVSVLGLLGVILGFLGVMYLLRWPPLELTISSTLLWQRVLERRKKRAPDYLRRLVSWLLVSIVALFAVLGLADPEFEWLLSGRRRLQIVIDNRPSMLAVDASGVSRWEAALGQARQLLEAESPASQVWLDLIRTGRVESGSITPQEALLRLATLGVGFSSEASFPATPPDIDKLLFLTSGEEGVEVPTQAETISVYTPTENISVESLDVQIFPDASAVIRVANLSQRSQSVRVSVGDSVGHIEAETVIIEAGQQASLTTSLEGFEPGPIVASLSGWSDSLALDDSRFDWLPRARRRVVLAGDRTRSLPTLLGQYPALDIEFVGKLENLELSTADALILSNWAPAEPVAVPVLLFGAPSVPWLPPVTNYFSGTEELSWDSEDPLIRGLNLRDLRVNRAANVEPGSARVVGRSRMGSLLLASDGAHPWAQLTFRLEDSNLERHSAFPILVDNFLKWVLDREVIRVELGEIELPAGSRVWDPQGMELEMNPGLELDRVVLNRPGIYSALTPLGRRQIIGNPEPITLPSIPSSQIPAPSSRTESPGFAWWRLLIGLALALGLSEWTLFHRRITV